MMVAFQHVQTFTRPETGCRTDDTRLKRVRFALGQPWKLQFLISNQFKSSSYRRRPSRLTRLTIYLIAALISGMIKTSRSQAVCKG